MSGRSEMALENVLIEKRGRIAIVTINRPEKLNALNIATRNEILEAFDQLASDDEIRVVIVTGAGEKAFIAGADINEFAGMTAIKQRTVMKGRRAFDSVEDFPKPVIAMINGFALGGGCELALACDIRIARRKQSLASLKSSSASSLAAAGTQRLTRLIGEGKSMELILTGDMISAEEAKQLGLAITFLRPKSLRQDDGACEQDRRAESGRACDGKGRDQERRANESAGRTRFEVDLFALCFSSEDKEEASAPSSRTQGRFKVDNRNFSSRSG